mgnify:CR=1 FL=1
MDVGHAMNVQRGMPFFVQSRCTSFAPQPAAVVLHPCRRSQLNRRGRSRQRSEKTEGKIKGRGTSSRRRPCLHVGWRGTRREAAACRKYAQCRIGIGEGACFARPAALILDGGTP